MGSSAQQVLCSHQPEAAADHVAAAATAQVGSRATGGLKAGLVARSWKGQLMLCSCGKTNHFEFVLSFLHVQTLHHDVHPPVLATSPTHLGGCLTCMHLAPLCMHMLHTELSVGTTGLIPLLLPLSVPPLPTAPVSPPTTTTHAYIQDMQWWAVDPPGPEGAQRPRPGNTPRTPPTSSSSRSQRCCCCCCWGLHAGAGGLQHHR